MLSQPPPVPEGVDDLAVAFAEGGVLERPVLRRPAASALRQTASTSSKSK